jgi:hypothetical protein
LRMMRQKIHLMATIMGSMTLTAMATMALDRVGVHQILEVVLMEVIAMKTTTIANVIVTAIHLRSNSYTTKGSSEQSSDWYAM